MNLNQVAKEIRESKGTVSRQREACKQYKGEHTQKSIMEEIKRQEGLREQRRVSKLKVVLSLQERLQNKLVSICQAQITERGLDTPTGWHADANPRITDYDPRQRLWVVGDEYLHHYSNSFGDWWQGASYLCGKDDGQYFALRVPKGTYTIEDALDYITPAGVKKAQAEGRWCERQGDVWVIELKSNRDNLRDLPGSHMYNPETRTISHEQHTTVTIPSRVKAIRIYQQTQVRSGGRGGAD